MCLFAPFLSLPLLWSLLVLFFPFLLPLPSACFFYNFPFVSFLFPSHPLFSFVFIIAPSSPPFCFFYFSPIIPLFLPSFFLPLFPAILSRSLSFHGPFLSLISTLFLTSFPVSVVPVLFPPFLPLHSSSFLLLPSFNLSSRRLTLSFFSFALLSSPFLLFSSLLILFPPSFLPSFYPLLSLHFLFLPFLYLLLFVSLLPFLYSSLISNISFHYIPPLLSSCRTVLISLTSVVVLVISTDWISWDNLNRGFLPSDEVSRAFLASFILVFDLLIVMQVDSSPVAN